MIRNVYDNNKSTIYHSLPIIFSTLDTRLCWYSTNLRCFWTVICYIYFVTSYFYVVTYYIFVIKLSCYMLFCCVACYIYDVKRYTCPVQPSPRCPSSHGRCLPDRRADSHRHRAPQARPCAHHQDAPLQTLTWLSSELIEAVLQTNHLFISSFVLWSMFWFAVIR